MAAPRGTWFPLMLLVGAAATPPGVASPAGAARDRPHKKPPLGWSSWNYLGTGPSASLLLDTTDAFIATGLLDHGFRYLIATEGWNLPNRSRGSPLQPAPTFTNATVGALADALHAKGFKAPAEARRAQCAGGSQLDMNICAALGREEKLLEALARAAE